MAANGIRNAEKHASLVRFAKILIAGACTNHEGLLFYRACLHYCNSFTRYRLAWEEKKKEKKRRKKNKIVICRFATLAKVFSRDSDLNGQNNA